MYKVAGCIAVLEIIGFLGFIIFSKHHEMDFIRYLPLLISFILVGYISYFWTSLFSYEEIVFVALIVSVIFVFLDQILGFTLYPGLAKGIGFISWENMVRTIIMLVVGMISHILLLIAIRIGRK